MELKAKQITNNCVFKINKTKYLLLTLTSLLFMFSVHTTAQSFVYTPRNPAFGGNSFNYQWMLSSAQAQDTYKENKIDSEKRGYYSDPVKDFGESLNRQILSRLSREIINRQFGEEGLEEGAYILGDYHINIGKDSDGININIVDNTTGSTTTISVPYF